MLNPQQRKKSIKIWLSDEERILVESKAKYYGYKRLAPYIRDAAIYEKVTYVDLKSKDELYKIFAENTKELKKIAKDIRHISKYATQLSNEELKKLSNIIYGMLKRQKEIIKNMDEKLDLDVWKEINHLKIEEMESEK